jgi:F0F1-type ATP synthase membrane subunit b/b'
MHQLPKDLWAEWAKRADVIVRELVEAIRNEEKAADLEGTIQRELQNMKERTA